MIVEFFGEEPVPHLEGNRESSWLAKATSIDNFAGKHIPGPAPDLDACALDAFESAEQ